MTTTAAVLYNSDLINFNNSLFAPQTFIAPDTFLGGLTLGNTNYGICDADKTAGTAARSYLPC